MNITVNDTDELNAVLKVEVEEEDYKGRYDSVLRDYRKQVRIDGFRPGMVPVGLVKKMYGKQILMEEVNKIISEEVNEYILKEKLSIIGQPLPSSKEQKPVNWDKQDKYEFFFDIAKKPEFAVDISNQDKIDYFVIKADDDLVNNNIDSHAKRFGTYIPVEKYKGEEMLRGNFTQLDQEGNIVENGITAENVSILPYMIKDDSIKKKFNDAEKGALIIFNPKNAFQDGIDLSSMFGINKDNTDMLDTDFRYEVSEIMEFKNAEVNQELFDNIFGKDVVKSEKEFREKVKEELEKQLTYESDSKFMIDAKDYMIKKYEIGLPEEFLKRWILLTNKEQLTEEKIEEEYKNFENEFRWQLIKEKIIKDKELSVSDEELLEYAKGVAWISYRNYGIMDPPEEEVERYANEIIKKEEEKERLMEKKFEMKVINLIKETAKLDKKEVSADEFNKLAKGQK